MTDAKYTYSLCWLVLVKVFAILCVTAYAWSKTLNRWHGTT